MSKFDIKKDGQKEIAVEVLVKAYPMANAHIGWEQSFHYGAWGENNAGA